MWIARTVGVATISFVPALEAPSLALGVVIFVMIPWVIAEIPFCSMIFFFSFSISLVELHAVASLHTYI